MRHKFIFTFLELLQSLKVIFFHDSLSVVNCLLHPARCLLCSSVKVTHAPVLLAHSCSVILATPVAVQQQQQHPKELIPAVPILLPVAASQGFLLPSPMAFTPSPAQEPRFPLLLPSRLLPGAGTHL